MGMFDTVNCQYKGLPQQIEFQTKSLNNELDYYKITFDGLLTKLERLGGYASWGSEYGTEYKSYNFTGTIAIYGTWPHNGRACEYEIDFIEGYISCVTRIK